MGHGVIMSILEITNKTIKAIEADIVELYKELKNTPINDINESHRIRVAIVNAEEIIEDLKTEIELC